MTLLAQYYLLPIGIRISITFYFRVKQKEMSQNLFEIHKNFQNNRKTFVRY